MASRAGGPRRLLAVAAIICAVGGLVLAASAVPLLASDSPTGDASEGTSSAEMTSEEASSMESAASEPRSDGGSGGIGGSTETDSGGESPGGSSSVADDRAPSGTAETVAGGVLYGLGTLFSVFGGDPSGDGPAADNSDSFTSNGDVGDSDGTAVEASGSDAEGMGGEFGSVLSAGDDPDVPDESGDLTAADAGGDPDPVVSDEDSDPGSLAGDDDSDTAIGDEDLAAVDGDRGHPPADGETDSAADEQGASDGIDAPDDERIETDGDEFDSDVDGGDPDSADDEGYDVSDRGDGNDDRGGDHPSGESNEDGLADGSLADEGDRTNGDEIDPSADETAGDATTGDELDDRLDESDEDAAGAEIGDDRSDEAAAAESGAGGAGQSEEDRDDGAGAAESGQEDESPLDSGSFGLSGTAIAAILVAVALLVAGYVLYRLDDPIATLRSIPGRLVSVVLSAVVACSQALERAVSALRDVGSIGELPGLVLAAIGRFVVAVKARARTARSSFDSGSDEFGAGDATEGVSITDRERIRNAFDSVIDASTMYRSQVSNATPSDVAGSAKRAGAPEEPVETITASFRDVEYGDRDPRLYLDSTESAHERLQAALAPTEQGADGENAVDGPVEAAE